MQVLRQLDICGYIVHKMFRRKARHADNGHSIGKCCSVVMEHLVIALWVSFSAPLAALGLLAMEITIADEIRLVNKANSIHKYQVDSVLGFLSM